MNPENTKKLFKSYKFLKKSNLPNGFVCGDGWFNLLNAMGQDLKALDLPQGFAITSVFDRHGKLDVHTKCGNLQTQVAIFKYTEESFDICDACGNNKDLQSCAKCKSPDDGSDTYVLDMEEALKPATKPDPNQTP